MPQDDPTAIPLARRLIEHGATGAAQDGATAAAREACERLYRELRYWVGADGANVLFRRALAQARDKHPSLQRIQLQSRSATLLGDLEESASAHGAADIVAGIEAMLVALLELLGRLIGDDMTLQFAEDSLLDRPHTSVSRLEKRRAE